jgi:hypothetical protein
MVASTNLFLKTSLITSYLFLVDTYFRINYLCHVDTYCNNMVTIETYYKFITNVQDDK